jgi:hypothetical protein
VPAIINHKQFTYELVRNEDSTARLTVFGPSKKILVLNYNALTGNYTVERNCFTPKELPYLPLGVYRHDVKWKSLSRKEQPFWRKFKLRASVWMTLGMVVLGFERLTGRQIKS